MASKKISLLLSDVDGTLLDSRKRITARTKAAIEKVHEAGIKFAVTSGRPPRGMKMIVEQVKLSAPIAAFNGGTFVEPDAMKVLNSRRLDNETAKAVIDRIGSFDPLTWIFGYMTTWNGTCAILMRRIGKRRSRRYNSRRRLSVTSPKRYSKVSRKS